MKKALVVITAMVLMAGFMPTAGHASDYEGKEESGSVFQKLSDLITGKYEVKGKTIKETGVVQVVADQIKDIKPAPVKD